MRYYRKTSGGILGAVDRVKKPLGGILAVLAIVTMLGFAGHDDLAEAQVRAKVPEIEEAIEEPKIIAETSDSEPAERISIGEFTITYYCACEACCGSWAKNRPKDADGNPIVKTASGAVAQAGKTIAVDPDVIPYGTEVILNGHTYTAQDCGGAIQGNRIDIYCSTHEEALQNGVDVIEVFMEVE